MTPSLSFKSGTSNVCNMAIDPDKYNRFREQLEELVEQAPVSEDKRDYIRNKAFDPIFSELDELIEESREPRLYVFGPAGSGKSSLINKLAEKEIADVGNVSPETKHSQLYYIEFPGDYADWQVVDSRGLFESLSPDGSPSEDTVELMKRDLEQYRPDILIQMITPDQLRAGKQNFRAVQEVRGELGESSFPPILYCLNKIDTHMDQGESLPPTNPATTGDIKENLEFMTKVVEDWNDIELNRDSINNKRKIQGYKYDSNEHIGAIPLYLKSEPYWNFRTLRWVIGDFLPNSAQLQYAQANRQEALLREIAEDVRIKCSSAAAVAGAAPSPIVDIAVITPLQYALIWTTAGLSCRELSKDNVSEYLTAMGLSSLSTFGIRKLARSLSQIVPIAGTTISATAAFAMTWAVGRSSELYFFDDTVKKPKNVYTEAERMFEDYKHNIPELEENN